jgi:hypothetical protein
MWPRHEPQAKRLFVTRNKIGFLALLVLNRALSAQSLDHEDLAKLLTEETTKHSTLTYTQHYIADDSGAVEYSGTLYLQIESITLHGCDLKMSVIVQDRNVGTEQKREHLTAKTVQLGQRSVTYHYTYQLNRAAFQNLKVDLMQGRPSQLHDHTGSVCEEDKSCTLPWLRIQTAKPAIKQTRVVSGILDFDQEVNSIAIPMTSHEIALQAVASFESLTTACQQ